MTLKLKEYLSKGNFIIPNYQRGYKWSVREEEKQSAVEVLMDDIINAYNNNYDSYFIQGVTVSEDNTYITLIDGQQRTTTLYILLWCLKSPVLNNISIDYEIRKDSMEYLNLLKKEETTQYSLLEFEKKHNHQDIHLFNEAISQITNKLDSISEEKLSFFCQFLLDKIELLYIKDENDSVKTFTMMNGNKASMLKEELIKAEILRQISSDEQEKSDEVSLLLERSRYARAWDKWLYWWNQIEVQSFYNVTNTPSMGLLLQFYFEKNVKNSEYTFQNFKKLISNKSKAKNVFKDMRDLQKSFEDIFYDPIIHNSLALALITVKEDKNTILDYYIENFHNKELLLDYSNWRLVGATHKEIISEDEESAKVKKDKAENVREKLSNAFVYGVSADDAFKQLLRLNVEEYNKLNSGRGLAFDFTIWKNKSLEHIYPKSKVYHQETNENGKHVWMTGAPDIEISKSDAEKSVAAGLGLFREDFIEGDSEHCIGNIVLLYGRNNSTFSDLPFTEKKNIYFRNDNKNFLFESRSLLHSMLVFANDEWTPEKIHQNKINFLKNFDETYKTGGDL